MHKLKNKVLLILATVAVALVYLGTLPGVYAQVAEVYIGGMPAGFTLGLGGAQIVGICEVLTEDGAVCPARDAGISVGDIIYTLNGVRIESAADIDKVLETSKGKARASVKRGGERIETQIQPAEDIASGKRKLGVLIRDSISGIGTVTYIEKESLRFASLGHAVADSTGKLMDVDKGSIFQCSIVNVVKGERGRAGELKGLFLNDKSIAAADTNCATGVYGNFNKSYDTSSLKSMRIGEDAQPGKASIFTTIDGVSPKEYSVSIVKGDEGNKQNKNYVIKVTDKELLERTGGIVQGMSGSPIVQNGKLIGAVTHVFLNDPTRGYGICIANMLGK